MNRGTDRIFVFCFQLLPTAHFIIIIIFNLKLYMRSSDDNNAQIMYARALWWCSFGAFVSIAIPIPPVPVPVLFCLRFHLFIMIIISFRKENHTRSQPQLTLTRLTHLINITHKQTNEQKKHTYLVCPHIIIISSSSTATKEQQQQQKVKKNHEEKKITWARI